LCTLRNAGFARSQLVCIDGSILTISYDGLVDFGRTDPEIRDPHGIASLCANKFMDILQFAERLRRASLDDVEMAALSQLIFAYYESKWFNTRSTLANYVDNILRCLAKHYDEIGRDKVLRMGLVSTLLGEFHKIRHIYHEIAVIVALYSHNGSLCVDEDNDFDCRTSHRLILKKA
jgi:hypothetical protein